MLVKLCMEKTDVITEVIVKRSCRFHDDTLRQLTQALIDSVQNSISNVINIYTDNGTTSTNGNGTDTSQQSSTSGVSGGTMDRSSSRSKDPARNLSNDQLFASVGRNELDAVLSLEYLSKLVMVNQNNNRTASIIWPIIHGCLCSVFDEKIDTLTILTPYLAERFVVLILRASIYQCNSSSFSSVSSSTSSSLNNSGPTTGNGACTAWSSLRLLRGVHSESNVSNISVRLSSGLYHLVHAIIENRTLLDLEQWYLMFSLLSAATITLEGQQYVFDALNKIIETNFVNDINFTPCRHLLMRFLHRAFPTSNNGDGLADSINRTAATRSSSNPWEGLALACLLRLTLMALGGYTNTMSAFKQQPKLDHKGATHLGHIKSTATTTAVKKNATALNNRVDDSSVRYITFPLPVEGNTEGSNSTTVGYTSFTSVESSSSSSFLSSTPSNVVTDNDTICSSSPTAADILKKKLTQVTVACVGFSKMEEVELLWIEATKIFSDVIGSEPLTSSRQAIFLLQTNLMSGSIVKLPKECWMKCIDEMLNRLPLDVKAMHKKFISTSHNKSSSNSSGSNGNGHNRLEDICDICLRCCNIMFEVMVSQFRQLLACKDFGVQWLNFMTILGVNVSSVSKSLHMHDEMIEMIGALLRLLRPLPIAVVAAAIDGGDVPPTAATTTSSTPGDSSSTPSNKNNLLPETVSFESFEEDTLLRESWKLLTQMNGNISTLLSHKHPKIVADLTALTKSPIPKPSSREKIMDEGDGDHNISTGDGTGDMVDANGNSKSEKRGSGLFSVLFG